MGEPFGPAEGYGILARRTSKPTLEPEDVCLFPDAAVPGWHYPVLFRDPAVAIPWVERAAAEGHSVGLVGGGSTPALVALLTVLKARGVTHVSIDPDDDEPELIPIADAIAGFKRYV